MLRFKYLIVSTSTLLAALSLAAQGSVAPYNFANFSEPGGNLPFTWTDNGGTSGSFSALSIPIEFTFTTPTGLSTVAHAATLSISGVTSTTAISAGGFDIQPLNSTETLTVTDNVTGKNLLSMSFTGSLIGFANGPNGSAQGGDISGQVVSFTSDYLHFTTPGDSYSIALNNVTPVLSIGPGGFLNSFASDLSGLFSGNATAVPEPATGLIFVGAAAAALIRRRR